MCHSCAMEERRNEQANDTKVGLVDRVSRGEEEEDMILCSTRFPQSPQHNVDAEREGEGESGSLSLESATISAVPTQ